MAININQLIHRYGDRTAVDHVSLEVRSGEIFGLLGPNGGGKSTLFKILSSQLRIQKGKVTVFEKDLSVNADGIRHILGVVFQSPSVDPMLTVEENIRHQGWLYGMRGSRLRNRIEESMKRLSLTDRRQDRVGILSGGLQRRVELAKAFLHQPKVMLMDEPSTGLDPGARKELWDHLEDIRQHDHTTILLTTHLMEEADKCDRVGILHHGKLVACDSPQQLRSSLGNTILTLQATEPESLLHELRSQFSWEASLVGGAIRVDLPEIHTHIPKLMERYQTRIQSLTLSRPSLEDVFIAKTGSTFDISDVTP